MFIISIIGTFAYAIRIVGVRTKRIAITSALFNIFIDLHLSMLTDDVVTEGFISNVFKSLNSKLSE